MLNLDYDCSCLIRQALCLIAACFDPFKREDYEIFYIESVLPLSSISEKTSQQVCQLAYENIKINVLNIIENLKLQSQIKIGSEFKPI